VNDVFQVTRTRQENNKIKRQGRTRDTRQESGKRQDKKKYGDKRTQKKIIKTVDKIISGRELPLLPCKTRNKEI
jgi:hypothetical protein